MGGDDTYIADNDIVIEAVNAGNDTIKTSHDMLELAANVEDLVSTGINLNLFGNRFDNQITGDDGNNLLDGGSGNDTLNGGVGDDIYVVDNANDAIIESTDGGRDTVWVQDSYTLKNDGTNDLEVMRADSELSVSMTGNSLANLLIGGAGDDILNGGGVASDAADSLYGGTGDDLYTVNRQSDVVVENWAEGNDTIQIAYNNALTTVSTITLGTGIYQNIENLTILGTGLFNLDGDDNDNRLIGNAAANLLTGGAGNDILSGGGSGDTYIAGRFIGYVNNPGDTDTIIDSHSNDTLELGIAGTQFGGHTYTQRYYNNISFIRRLTAAGSDNLEIDSVAYDITDGSDVQDGSYERVIIEREFDAANLDANGRPQIVGVNNIRYADGVTTTLQTLLAQQRYQFIGSDFDDQMQATADTIALHSGDGNDVLLGSSGKDFLYGDEGNDFLTGGAGNDMLYGGVGDDTYVFTKGDGVDTIFDYQGISTIALDGINADDPTVIFERLKNSYRIRFTDSSDMITFSGSIPQIAFRDTSGAVTSILNNTQLESRLSIVASTGGNDFIYGSSRNDSISGLDGYDTLMGGAGDDSLYGGSGNDVLDGGTGADLMDGGSGNSTFYVDNAGDRVVGQGTVYTNLDNYTMLTDQVTDVVIQVGDAVHAGSGKNVNGNSGGNTITGNNQSNFIQGRGGNDLLYTDSGIYGLAREPVNNDILQGGSSEDTLFDTSRWGGRMMEKKVLDGGDDNDQLLGGGNINLLIGGKGNDHIEAGTYADGLDFFGETGNDIIAYNKGDGQDTVFAGDGAKLTLSLGGGLQYSDLAFSKSGNDLTLKTGTTDSITFYGWYISTVNHSVATLQILAEGMAGYSLGGGDALRDNKIENFNFAELVSQFDAEGAIDNWQLTDARLGAHLLAGSDTAMIGGDLAYQYGKTGALNEIILNAAQDVIGSAQFGQTAQTLNSQYGDAGNNNLNGGAGGDYLSGGAGNDTLTGGIGNDTYILGRGYGVDTVVETDATAGNTDVAQFMAGVSADQLWFVHSDNNLEVDIIGTGDKLIVQDWYSGSANHVEQFKITDGGLTLLDSQVENLVSAMAAFAPPAAGQTTLPVDYQASLAPVIAANWQ